MAALALGSSVLSAFLGVLFDRMAKPEFLNLFRKQNYDDSVLKKLQRKLRVLRAVLEDAESKQTKSEAVKDWIDQLQEVLYEADDLIDQLNTEALRVEVESQYPSPATNQVSASNLSNFSIDLLKEIMPKLVDIVDKLDELSQDIGFLGLVAQVEPRKLQCRPPSTSLVENDECGRDDDKEKIIHYLLSNDGNSENFTVISLFGLGGIGKTTLAKLVYNDEMVKKQFDTKAWVCISEEYDSTRITKSLLNELGISCSDPNETFNSLQLKLQEGLSQKKFLLVLDDIWNRNYNDWLVLSSPFSGGKEGSKIILTTRDEQIARTIGKHVHHLEPMSEEDCLSLFEKHALSNRDDIGNFKLIGKEIVKKCGGLPLAVKTVAGLLRSKETIEQWNEILRSDEWDTSNDQAIILPSLRLSYTHLSSHLKRCFAYCAVFHKDYHFSKNEVILLWMANDLLEIPQRSQILEDVGDEFFRELRLRSLFQQSSDGRFSMHDLVNDLAKFVSGRYFLRLAENMQQNCPLIVPRHFSYIHEQCDELEKYMPLNQPRILRTFLPLEFNRRRHVELSEKFLLDILPMFMSLKVLSLSCYYIFELPDSLSNLRQLRFLDLSHTYIKRLPSWICRFYNLQTLLLAGCLVLKDFPEDMEKLINLRYLDISDVPLTKMPFEIGRLKNIQSLSTYIVSKENGSRIEELGKLCNLLGKLTIFGLENVASGKNASMAKMKDKKYIQKLFLKWDGDTEDSHVVHDVLENLKPHTNIKHLEIQGYCGTKFPDWLQDSSFCHITDLHISNCENCYCLPAIWQLPSLKHLTLRHLSKVFEIGQANCGNNCLEELEIENCPELIGEIPKQLPSLKKLAISRCPRLVNSNGELSIFECKADFSSLEELEIVSMPNLKELSSSKLDPNKFLPCLVKLNIKDCPEIECFPEGGLPSSLQSLHIVNCERLWSCHGEWDLQRLPSLAILELYGDHPEETWPPKDLLLPSTLTCLYLGHNENVKTLNCGALHRLTCLRSLSIYNCPKFQSLQLPEEGIPASLAEMWIFDCPKLQSLPEKGLPASLTQLGIVQARDEKGLPATLTQLGTAESRYEKGLPARIDLRFSWVKGRDSWPKVAHIP